MFEEVRAAGRVVWNGAAQAWMLPHYDECVEVFTDTRAERFGMVGARYPELTFWFDAPNMVVSNPPEHRRLRKPVAPYFTPTAMARRWEARVREIIDERVAANVAEGSVRIEDFTKIPLIIVAEMLGIPEERHDDFRRWSDTVTGNVGFGLEHDETRRVMEKAAREAQDYIIHEIARHRVEQPDDVLTAMLSIPTWSEAEIVSSALNFLLAGYETTARLMVESLVVLEQFPDQRRMLVEQPELIPNAIEEINRWAGAAQAIPRVVLTDTVLAGTPLRQDETIWPLMRAANRDPTRWPDPDRFDIRRPYLSNLGFGSGLHVCIGAPLARLEIKVAIETVLRYAPEYHLRDVEYAQVFIVRGPEKGVIEVGVP
jgi:cytochrome P450